MKDGPRLDGDGQPLGEPTPEDVRRGRVAAVVLFAVCALVQIAVTGAAKLHPGKDDLLNAMQIDAVLALVAPLVAVIVGSNLPQRSRGAFWTTGILCIFLTFLLWGVTCTLM